MNLKKPFSQSKPALKPAGSQEELLNAYRQIAEYAFGLQEQMKNAACEASFTVRAKYAQRGDTLCRTEVRSAQDAVDKARALPQNVSPRLFIVPRPDGKAGNCYFDISFLRSHIEFYGLPHAGVADGYHLGYDHLEQVRNLFKRELSRDSRISLGDAIALKNIAAGPLPAPA
jgi:hypothetical protein